MSSTPLSPLTLLIDTNCLLCLRAGLFLQGINNQGLLQFRSLYNLETLALPTPPPPLPELKRAMRALDGHGAWHVGPLAVGQAFIRTHAPWSWIGHCLLWPAMQWLTQPVYGWIAANRYKFLPPLDEAGKARLLKQFPSLSFEPQKPGCNNQGCPLPGS
jgi:predicted DCC family thiol-disulfide oxidoreductase YuxK